MEFPRFYFTAIQLILFDSRCGIFLAIPGPRSLESCGSRFCVAEEKSLARLNLVDMS